MTTKTPPKEPKNQNKSGAEKPVSLWGASFTEVMAALLKTRSMPKEQDKDNANKNIKKKT